jgi:hypothetical protein
MNSSEAVVIYLKHYPAGNKAEFDLLVKSEVDRQAVQNLLDETIAIPIEWGTKNLTEIGGEVTGVLHERHPELSTEAITALRNYFTYLVK